MSTSPPDRSPPAHLGFRSRLADPRLISWYSLAISSALLSYEIWLRGIAVFALSQVFVFALLAIARVLYLRRRYPRRHAWVMMTTVVVSSFFGVVLAQIPFTTSDTVVAADGAFSRMVVIPIAGLLSISLSDYRATMHALRTSREQLTITRDEGLAAMASARREMALRVESSLETTLTSLTADDPSIDHRHLASLAQDTVRPLSHELASGTPEFTPRSVDASRVQWSTVLAEVAVRPLIVPWLMALGVTILSIRFTFAQSSDPVGLSQVTFGPLTLSINVESLIASFTFLAVILISVWLLSLVIARVTRPILPRLSGGTRWLVVAASVLAIGVGLQIVLVLALSGIGPLGGIESDPWGRFWAFAPVVVIALVLAFVRTVSLARSALVHQQELLNADLAWEIAKIRLDLWAQQRRFAQAVHGPLQAAITASALLIAQAPEDSARRADLVRDAHDRIVKAFHTVIDDDASVASLNAALEDIVRTWSGVCEVKLDVGAAAHAALAHDNTCRQATVMVVGEAVANAVIHGHATRAQVDIAVTDGRFITVMVVNDGDPSKADPPSGLGSAMLDDVSGQWHVTNEAEGTRLTAVLASTSHS